MLRALCVLPPTVDEARRVRQEDPGTAAQTEVPGVAVPRDLVAWVAPAVAASLALLTTWLVRDWPTDRGLFDYRSATIGYGLLVPLGIAAAVTAASSLEPTDPASPRRGPRQHRQGAAAGAGLAIAVQVVWLLDPDPLVNWSLPEAGRFNAAGWIHAACLVVVSAAGGAALQRLARSLAGATPDRVASIARARLLDLTVLGGAGTIALAAIDNWSVQDRASGLSSTIALGLAALALVAALGFAARRGGTEVLLAILRGAVATTGLCLLAVHGVERLTPVETGAAAVIAIVLSAGILAPRVERVSLAGMVDLITTALLGIGAIAFGVHLVGDAGLAAALLVLATGAVLTRFGRLGGENPSDQLLAVTGVAFTLGLVVLAGWLRMPGRTGTEANYAIGFATFFLDGLVIGLIRERFAEVVRVDRSWYAPRRWAEQRGGEAAPPSGAGTGLQVIAIGLAALLALALLYIEAAGVLGADDDTGPSTLSTARLVAGFGVAAAFVATAGELARRGPAAYRPPALPVRADAAVLAVLGLGGWAAVLVSELGALHFAGFAVAAAAAIGLLTFEDLVRTPVRLHLHEPDGFAYGVAGAAGLTSALAVFLVATTALWSDERPAATGSAFWGTAAVLVATALLIVLAARVLTQALPIPRLTPEPALFNVLLVQGLYAALTFIAVVIPVSAVARIEAADPANSGLAAVSAAAPVPALLGALVWVLHTNSTHVRDQDPEEIPANVVSLAPNEAAQRAINTERLRWLACHVNFQNRQALALVTIAGVWAAIEIVA